MTPYGFPSEYYHCLLDEQPYYLVPTRLFDSESSGPLVVNPRCWFAWHGALPPDKAARAAGAEHLLPSDWMIWVDDPGAGGLWPYWLGEEFIHWAAHLFPGCAPTIALPPHVEWAFRQARILVAPGDGERRRSEWLRVIAAAAPSFERGYAGLAGLIPALHLGALRRYYRYHTRAGSFALGDGQVDRRFVAHDEPVARFFHAQLAQAVSDIARTVVKPSYCYLAAYESGSFLPSHTDREQCEYSVTLCVDASPEPAAETPWPLRLDSPDGTLHVWQHLGDGLLYRGRHLPHSREPLPAGYTSTSLLFHYVDQDYRGTLS
jgi:hypothetical protein